MPEGPDGKTIIVIKKVVSTPRPFGGQWKVAYADFVTSMMALFMVLWLVNSASEPTRQRIASYFRQPGIFQRGSGTPLQEGGQGILPQAFTPPADANSQLAPSNRIYELEVSGGDVPEFLGLVKKAPEMMLPVERELMNVEASPLAVQPEQVARAVERLEKEVTKSPLGDVQVGASARGILIEITDTAAASMFEVGEAAILPAAERELVKIAAIIKDLPNPIDIEGHTDGRPFAGPRAESYDNWNLSSDRANAARRVLEKAGVAKGRISRVVGYADQRPKAPEDPLNPSNRRITMFLSFRPVNALDRDIAGALGAGETPEAALQSVLPAGAGVKPVDKWSPSDAPEEDGGADALKLEIESFSKPEEKRDAKDLTELKDKIFGKDNPFFPF